MQCLQRRRPRQAGPRGCERLGSADRSAPELAAKPLATVGDRVITLGEFAATLERIDQFERLRYQSVDRRRQLLDEIINAELLAQEAKRRGLDKQPEVEGAHSPDPARGRGASHAQRQSRHPRVTQADVQAYYDKHRDDFREPERRRVAHIVLTDKAKAQAVLEQAKKASPTEWGKLVREQSLDKPAGGGRTGPLELAGDLGLVAPPGVERGDNARVPDPLRNAVFEIDKLGGVYRRARGRTAGSSTSCA